METARTPLEKHLAREEGLAVKRDLELQIAGDAAVAAFKNAKPQNSARMYKGGPNSGMTDLNGRR
jgi:hypothetical protein